jgi:Ca-activated chloride channel family protein
VNKGGHAGWSAIDLGDLPAGRPLWVAGRLPRGETTDLILRVTATGQPEVAAQRLDLAKEASHHPALKALFGARRILGLEFLISSGYAGEQLTEQLARLGYDPQQVLIRLPGTLPKVYAENVRAEAQAALHDLLVGEALDYGLACSETAFVAVRREAGKPVEGTVLVANALPSGWSEEFLLAQAMPAFAMPAAAGGPRAQAARTKMAPAMPAYPRMFRVADSGARPQLESRMLFSGVPQFTNDEALLFDSSRAQDAQQLPDSVQIVQLKIHFSGGVPKPQALDPRMSLLIFVDDLSAPRASVRLVDLVRQGGERPLNILRPAGQVVRLVLVSAGGAWAYGVLQVEVALQVLGR